VDVGGGLGVDYEGSRSTRPASVNYSMREYANDVVYTLGAVCRNEDLPMPHIISESGRAITAHHSLLLINVIDVESQIEPVAPPLGKKSHPLLVEMAENLEGLSADRVEEVFHDVVFAKERAQEYFASGVFSLREKANADLLYLVTLNALQQVLGEDRLQFPEIAAHIDAELVDRYFCNFSVFQSLPDSWAIDQLFPIMPIHRLLEPPTRRGTLQDVTCDSDGVIDRFAGGRKGKPSLELHPVREGEPYILGIFLTGAYQEILGDLHNLFGDTDAVHVRLDGDEYRIEHVVEGDSVMEVLASVQYSKDDLVARVRQAVEAALRDKRISMAESGRFMRRYEESLEGYTYLSVDD
jgi:arginine decarboxylase